MFSKAIIGSARFLRMPPSSRLLYYDLGMYADDEGIVEAFTVMRQTGSTEDDLRVLVAKGFVRILNEDLVTVITDWNENNYIRGDRKKKSIYNHLLLAMADTCPSSGNHLTDTCPSNVSIGKDRIGEDRVGEDRIGEEKFRQDVKEIVSYLNEMTGTHYRPSADYIKTLVHARMEDGFSVDDFKTVIFKKAREWIGTEHQKYLRPQTLFGTKFEAYLNQLDAPANQPNGADDMNGFYAMMEDWANDE